MKIGLIQFDLKKSKIYNEIKIIVYTKLKRVTLLLLINKYIYQQKYLKKGGGFILW